MKSLLLIFSLLSFIQSLSQTEELFFAITLSHHGARFPTIIPAEWAKNSGGITHVGMRQMYLLGRELRKQYIEDSDLIDEQYNPKQFLLRASSFNRTTTCQSAYAFARGLYLPGSGYALSKDQIERAVPPANFSDIEGLKKSLRDAAIPNYFASLPVMIQSGGPDYSLVAPIFCTNMPKMITAYQKNNPNFTEKIKTKEENYQKLVYPKLKEAFKVDINSMGLALAYRDLIVTAKYYGIDLKYNFSEETLKLLDEMYSLVNYEIPYSDYNIARVMSHGVIEEIYKELNSSLKAEENNIDKSNRRSMMSYVVHEGNLYGFFRLLNYSIDTYQVNIPFASTLQIEVFKEYSRQGTFVRFFYNGEQIKFNNLETDIDINAFMNFLNKTKYQNTKEFEKYCLGIYDEVNDTPWIAVAIVIGGALLVMLVITCVFIMKKDKEEGTEDKPLTKEEPKKEGDALEYNA